LNTEVYSRYLLCISRAHARQVQTSFSF